MFRSGPLKGGLQEKMYFLLGCVRCASGKYDLIDRECDFQRKLFKNQILHDIFMENSKRYEKWGQDTAKVRKWIPGWAKVKERAPKVSQGTPKVSQKGPKGSQKGAKSEPKGDLNASKNRPSEKVSKKCRLGGVRGTKFGSKCWLKFIKNRWKNRCENRCRKSHENWWKINAKMARNLNEQSVFFDMSLNWIQVF